MGQLVTNHAFAKECHPKWALEMGCSVWEAYLSHWSCLTSVQRCSTSAHRPEQPQPFEFANMLEQLFAGNPGRPMVQPCLTEAPWTMAAPKKGITRLKTNKAGGDIVTVVSDGAFDKCRKHGNKLYSTCCPKKKEATSTSDFCPIARGKVFERHLCIWCWVG